MCVCVCDYFSERYSDDLVEMTILYYLVGERPIQYNMYEVKPTQWRDNFEWMSDFSVTRFEAEYIQHIKAHMLQWNPVTYINI